jgi:guanosine-3',5'-bis(diphosphate) 3'-pyrophosphohydrolase
MTKNSVAADLLDAVMFAADRHQNQRRKDAEASPYINHPIALAHLLATVGAVVDLDVLRAAILHDTVEDTETNEAELRERFGDAVAGIVMEVTDDKDLLKQRRKELQVEYAPHLSSGAALVKLADKTCNLRNISEAPPTDWSLAKRQEYFDWAKSVVDALPPVSAPLLAAFHAAYAARPTGL